MLKQRLSLLCPFPADIQYQLEGLQFFIEIINKGLVGAGRS